MFRIKYLLVKILFRTCHIYFLFWFIFILFGLSLRPNSPSSRSPLANSLFSQPKGSPTTPIGLNEFVMYSPCYTSNLPLIFAWNHAHTYIHLHDRPYFTHTPYPISFLPCTMLSLQTHLHEHHLRPTESSIRVRFIVLFRILVWIK